ncbi:MAG: hypothetical protein K0R52_1494 [Alphaproteobacteria bacterium]|jgi:NADH dehydrogenase [ubiquinone] 1 alpha subcomplex assembly factor 7|nr:hypothetical protein [Alphaproteobacteria bacterium]
MSLTNRLKAQIEATGPIPLPEFMEQVLYDPEYGYYYQKVPIGRAGDYITAPEMTQVFGEVIALWLIDIWQQAGRPTPFHLVELGPGRGTLMADMLKVFQSLNMPLSDMAVHLVEVAPRLKDCQQAALSSFPVSVFWHKDLSTLPHTAGFCLMVANEFWDALPLQQFVNINEDWVERRVGTKGDAFIFLPEGSTAIREICPAMPLLVSQIADHLTINGGAALFLDYGYDQPNAIGETLQALQHHQRQSPLANVGKADLTHHVDFQYLKTSFKTAGLTTYGPIPQGNFLKAMGLDIRTERLCERATSEQCGALRTSAVRLTHPAHMGTLFKAMAVVSDASLQPAGF